MGSGGTLLIRSALTDGGVADDNGWVILILLSLLDSLTDSSAIVAINLLHLPVVSLETLSGVITEPVLDITVDGDVIGVV